VKNVVVMYGQMHGMGVMKFCGSKEGFPLKRGYDVHRIICNGHF
jgi:hypothetical protein